jgi:hypothetical protein
MQTHEHRTWVLNPCDQKTYVKTHENDRQAERKTMSIRELLTGWEGNGLARTPKPAGQPHPIPQFGSKATPARPDVVTDPGWCFRVAVGDTQVEGRLWDGRPLGSPLAFDTETSLITSDHEVPRLALVVASDGQRHVVVLPDQLPAFIGAHADAHWIAHHLAFDYFVVRQYLASRRAARIWQDLADNLQLHCTLTLAQLVDIAERDDLRSNSYSLAALGERYLGLRLDKNDPYRCRFGELVGHDWDQPVDLRFLEYALPDAIICYRLWQALRNRCQELARRHAVPASVVKQHGYLGEALITRSDLAFRAMQIRGVELDRGAVNDCFQELKQQALVLVEAIDQLEPDYFAKFKERKRAGQYRYPHAEAVVPSARTRVLLSHLQALAERLALEPPRTERSGQLQTKAKYWQLYAEHDEFVGLWCQLSDARKLLQFFEHLRCDCVHPHYGKTRSGRASAERLNIQQMPGKEAFRRLFVPGPDKLVLGLDYSSIEMLTLAAECQARYGHSRLREVLKSGVDPHAFTAAMLLGISDEAFQALATTDKAKYELNRKKAKIANFGFPAGYSAQSLAFSAKIDRGVEMSVAEAEMMRDRFLHQIYPELGEYLTECLAATLADNLRVPLEVVHETFSEPWHLPMLRRLCDGELISRTTGAPYDQQLVEAMWSALAELDTTGRYAAVIAVEDYEQLRKLFWQPTVNPVGMIRAAVPFTASRNTPFQSRAAMGMRNALWKLHYAGFELMTCVHDEVVIAVPESADHAALAKQADSIMRQEMQPFCADIPVKTEFYLARHWSKEAKARWSDDGRLLVWSSDDNI